MSETKRKRIGEREYVCHDCVATFIMLPPPGTKKVYCPLCADYIAVTFSKEVKQLYRAWTDEETEMIDKYIAGKISVYDIMKTTGRNEKAVRGKVDRRRESKNSIKVVIGNWTEEEDNLVIRSIKGEIKAKEAAKAIGRTYDQVRSRKSYLRRKGIS